MKKRILIIFYALLLCVTASFAWLSNFQPNKVTNLSVDYSGGALTVADLDFDAHIEVPDEKGEYRALSKDEQFSFDSKKMVPDTITPFKIKIKNNSETEYRKAKLSIALKVDAEEMSEANVLDVMYLEVVAGDGFGDGITYHVYVRLDEASVVGDESNGEYFYYIYGEGDEILIPPTTADKEYVTLDCSFYYDQNATAEYQNKSIQAISFRLE